MSNNIQNISDAAFITISLSILMGFKETPEHISYCDTLKHLLFDPNYPESNPLIDRDYPTNPLKIESLSTDQVQNIVAMFGCLVTNIDSNATYHRFDTVNFDFYASNFRLVASKLADKFRAIENQKEEGDLAKYAALNN